MSTQISTPPPSTSRKQHRRPQPAYASDSGVSHQAQQATQNAASDTNGSVAQHNTSRRKREKKPRPQAPRAATSTQIPNLDGALSPRPSPAQARVVSVQSPPPTVSTPMKQAYAGPTFHASPAASSLPKPKFFSKSVPSTTPASALQARLDADPNRDQSETPSPESEVVLEPVPPRPQQTPIAREESPLDLFFNAHRAEQARRDSSGTLSPRATPSRLTPSLLNPSPSRPVPATLPRPTHSQQQTPNPTPSSKQMFQMEVDGTAETEADYESSDYDSSQQRAPRHSIPFSDRLRGYNGTASPAPAQQRPATHSGHQQFAPHPQPQSQHRPPTAHASHLEELHRQAQSQALKRMLMLKPDESAHFHGSPNQVEVRHARQVSAPSELPAPDQDCSATAGHGHAGPQTNGYESQINGYASYGYGQNHRDSNSATPDVRSMEADLKRMLKLI